MKRENITICKAIVHILDAAKSAIYSVRELEFGSEFTEFLQRHIEKESKEDDRKECHFYEEESEIYSLLQKYESSSFVQTSREIAELLYKIMSSNISIPSADLAVVEFKYSGEKYLALLKMNYKKAYTHFVISEDGEGMKNEIGLHKSLLPSATSKLQEAAIIQLSDMTVWVNERKYEINGEKVNYFSKLFLKCGSSLTTKGKMNIVERTLCCLAH